MTRTPGPFLLRDLTEPSRFKNLLAPIRLLRILILQLVRGDFFDNIDPNRTRTTLASGQRVAKQLGYPLTDLR